MAGNIKGITIELNGDTTKLDKALRNVQAQFEHWMERDNQGSIHKDCRRLRADHILQQRSINYQFGITKNRKG